MTTPARSLAIRALCRWEEGTEHLEEILENLLEQESNMARRDRALAWQIALGVVRHRALLDHRLLALMNHPLPAKHALVWSALRAALFQCLFLRVPPRAAIHETVNLIKNSRELSLSGFANAVLRRSVNEPPPTPPTADQPLQDLAIHHAFPLWMVERWDKTMDRAALLRRLVACNQIPPLTLHVNTAVQNRPQVMEEWSKATIPCQPGQHGTNAILLEEHHTMLSLPGYGQGWFAAQDQGAQLAVPLLRPQAGDRILDACAAPGGKAGQLLANQGIYLTVVEKDARRMGVLQQNLTRLHLLSPQSPVCVTGDVSNSTLLADATFNKALLDAPCSGTGVIRRHPEIKWRLQPQAIAQLAAQQSRLLTSVARRIEVGGTLIYATCSLEAEENQQVIQSFLQRHPDWRLSPITTANDGLQPALFTSEGFLRIEPGHDNMDGHFAARLVRTNGHVATGGTPGNQR